MIDQKNRMDPPTTVRHHQENEVDFELLWRYISKILNQFGMAIYPLTTHVLKYKYRNNQKFEKVRRLFYPSHLIWTNRI